jgi:hypothetical protein
VTDGVINSLSRVPELKVMARSTVFSYKGHDVNAQKVGKELNVDAVLMGRISQRADTISIQTDLVNVTDGSELWGDQYKRKMSDLLTVQGDIAKEIYTNLRPRLTGETATELGKHATEDPEAYQVDGSTKLQSVEACGPRKDSCNPSAIIVDISVVARLAQNGRPAVAETDVVAEAKPAPSASNPTKCTGMNVPPNCTI